MTAPLIRVEPGAATPAYEQIRGQIAGLVATGTLTAGERLPTVRALAADLGIAVNTVARAYHELESAGVVVTRRRLGTVVADGVESSTRAVAEQAHVFARVALGSGLDESSALDLVRSALRAAAPR
jgi:GntR family transcriptional regulator